MNGSKLRLMPLTGILSVLLVIAGFLFGEPPDASHSADEITQYYVDNESKLEAGVFVFGVALVFFVFFASYLRTVLDRGEGETGMLTRVAFAGAVMFAVGGTIDAMLLFSISESVSNKLDPVQVQTLQAIWDNDWPPLAVGLSLFILACGLSIVLHRSLPVWLGWVAIVIGVAGLTPFGFVAFPGAGLWILVVSVMLLISERQAAEPAPA